MSFIEIKLNVCPCTRAIDRFRARAIDRFSLANTRAGQSERCVPPAPIRTPKWSSRLSGQRRILFTQPHGTPEHKRHLLISFRRLYFPFYIFPPHLSVICHRAIMVWVDRDMVGGCSYNKSGSRLTFPCRFINTPHWKSRPVLLIPVGP